MDFIEVYPDSLDAGVCQQLIKQFEASGQAKPGRTGSGVDKELKNSYDITISNHPEWEQAEAIIQEAAFKGIYKYIRKYRFALIAPLALRFCDANTGQIILINETTFDNLSEARYIQLLATVFRSGPINIQKYLSEKGGYPHWHSEIYPMDPQGETLHRVLLYTFYLNNIPEAGETEFYYQRRKIKPKIGSLLIAPAGFTHTHRGNMPIGSDKYIITSWILFSRAESLYSNV